jgi:FAD synthase
MEPDPATVAPAPCGPRTAGTHLRRPQFVEGVVEHGDKRGHELGFPTANVVIDDDVASDGVWAGTVDVDGETYVAMVSVGRRATFYECDGIRLLEAHLLDFAGDLYDRRITVHLQCFLRPQRRFATVRILIKQMHRDLAATCVWWQQTGSATAAWPGRSRPVNR